jgi:hypothetical protein
MGRRVRRLVVSAARAFAMGMRRSTDKGREVDGMVRLGRALSGSGF